MRALIIKREREREIYIYIYIYIHILYTYTYIYIYCIYNTPPSSCNWGSLTLLKWQDFTMRNPSISPVDISISLSLYLSWYVRAWTFRDAIYNLCNAQDRKERSYLDSDKVRFYYSFLGGSTMKTVEFWWPFSGNHIRTYPCRLDRGNQDDPGAKCNWVNSMAYGCLW